MIILILLLTATFYIFKYYRNVARYPRGPFPLPLIGNLHQYDWGRAQLQLSEWSKEYGPVFTIFLPRPFVCIMDYDSLKEAFVTRGDDFSGRSQVFPDTIFRYNDNGGILFADGDSWRDHRRFSIQTLRDFGMGKNKMEEQVLRSMRDTLKYMKTLNTDEIEMRWPIQLFVSNVIAVFLIAKWFDYTDLSEVKAFSNSILDYIETIKVSKLFFLSQTWPWLAKIPLYKKYALQKVLDSVVPMKTTVWKLTMDALDNYDPNSEPECLTHSYALLREKIPELTNEEIASTMMDFFIAGMETSSTTLKWAVLYMAVYQDIQDKSRDEIAKNIGFDELPKMSDRAKLPYCNAILNEIQRVANIVPLIPIHRTLCDTQVAGYPIPKDTFCLGQISNVLSQSERFDDPASFKPERFLMPDGKTPNKEALEHLVAFGMGKRQCAGEALARVELFVGLVALLQNYKITPLPGRTIDLEPVPGQVLCPKLQEIRLTSINANKNTHA